MPQQRCHPALTQTGQTDGEPALRHGRRRVGDTGQDTEEDTDPHRPSHIRWETPHGPHGSLPGPLVTGSVYTSPGSRGGAAEGCVPAGDGRVSSGCPGHRGHDPGGRRGMDGFVMNARENLVRQALEGLEVSDGELVRLNRDPAFVTRADPARDEVAVISGGGSGHEPLHTGFVGRGMLHAAVPGEVFASPTALQVRAAIEAADTGRGTVLVIKNYTGDVLNFSIAADLLSNTHTVETVLVDDDLATSSEEEGGPGDRKSTRLNSS